MPKVYEYSPVRNKAVVLVILHFYDIWVFYTVILKEFVQGAAIELSPVPHLKIFYPHPKMTQNDFSLPKKVGLQTYSKRAVQRNEF